MKKAEITNFKKLAGLLTEDLDVSWNPYAFDFSWGTIESKLVKKTKQILKDAGFNPNEKYPVQQRAKINTLTDIEAQTVEETVKDFLISIKSLVKSPEDWVGKINNGIEDDWQYDRQRHPDDEVDMTDFDEETELVHDENDLVNQVVKDLADPKRNVPTIILSNPHAYWSSRLSYHIFPTEKVYEAIDVNWNPYSDEEQDHCLILVKSRTDNPREEPYMGFGEMVSKKQLQAEINKYAWKESKKIEGDGYNLHYFFNDLLNTWVFLLDISPKSEVYSKVQDVLESPGGVLFSDKASDLLHTCVDLVTELNPHLDRKDFAWR